MSAGHERPSRYCRCGCGYPTANRNGYREGHLVPADTVTLPGGGVVSRVLAELGDAGWGEDRDSTDLAKLAELYTIMDREVNAWLTTSDGGDVEGICGTWLEIRRITRG